MGRFVLEAVFPFRAGAQQKKAGRNFRRRSLSAFFRMGEKAADCLNFLSFKRFFGLVLLFAMCYNGKKEVAFLRRRKE